MTHTRRREKELTMYRMIFAVTIISLAVVAEGRVIQKPEPVADQYIVTLHDSVPRSAVVETAMAMTLQHRGRLLGSFSRGVRGFGIEMAAAEAEALSNDPAVARIEQNGVGHLSYSVEYYGDDTFWHLDRIDQRTTINPFMTKAYAWTSTGAGVAVYVIDAGVQAAHSEFNGNVVAGGNFALENSGPTYAPDNPCGGFVNALNPGHGTAVASIVAGQHVGVARDATIIAVKVSTCKPNDLPLYGFQLSELSIVQSLDWVIGDVQAHPSRRAVATMSVYVTAGHFCNGFECAGALDNNVRNLVHADDAPDGTYGYGVVVTASANNQYADRCTEQSPARLGYGGMYDPGNQPSWPFVITVGGTDINDARWYCPSCPAEQGSPSVGSNVGACVDIYAPAKVIHAAHIATANAYRDQQQWTDDWNDLLHTHGFPNTTYAVDYVASGTSFSAPLVAGIAARLRQTFPNMKAREVWNYIHDSATALPSNFDGDGKADNDRLAYISPFD